MGLFRARRACLPGLPSPAESRPIDTWSSQQPGLEVTETPDVPGPMSDANESVRLPKVLRRQAWLPVAMMLPGRSLSRDSASVVRSASECEHPLQASSIAGPTYAHVAKPEAQTTIQNNFVPVMPLAEEPGPPSRAASKDSASEPSSPSSSSASSKAAGISWERHPVSIVPLWHTRGCVTYGSDFVRQPSGGFRSFPQA